MKWNPLSYRKDGAGDGGLEPATSTLESATQVVENPWRPPPHFHPYSCAPRTSETAWEAGILQERSFQGGRACKLFHFVPRRQLKNFGGRNITNNSVAMSVPLSLRSSKESRWIPPTR